MKFLEKIFKICWVLFAAVLIFSTVLEQSKGAGFVLQYLYGSPAFFLFACLFLFLGIVIAIKSKIYKKSTSLFLLSVSPVWLLCGAALNFFNLEGKIFFYAGYLWFTLFFLIYLFSKNGSFRSWLRKLFLWFLLLLSIPFAFSQRTISKDVAIEMGKLVVEYDGRLAPLQSLCNDCLVELYGSDSYKQFSSVQVVIGWVLFPEDWIREPLVKVSNRAVQRQLHCGKYVAPICFFTTTGEFSITQCADSKNNKQLQKISQKLTMLQLLRLGTPFKIFPKNKVWYSPTDDLSAFSNDERNLCDNFFILLYNNTLQSNSEKNIQLVQSVRKLQKSSVDAPSIIKTELCYNQLRGWLGNSYALFLMAIITFFCFVKSIKNQRIWLILRLIAIFFCFLLLLHLGVRTYLSGHLPLSNGYETLLLLSFLIMLITSILWNKSRLIPFAGFLLCGLSLLVMNFSFNSPKISVLSSVLDSPWLSLHVTTIMAAYSLLSFTFILALLLLFLQLFHKMDSLQNERITLISRALLLPGIVLLVVGIMLGSVWGDSAWGTYWSWDPKEVWALITFLVYAPAAQPSFFRRFQKTTFYHIYIVIAFASLLITYFGVNVWFGGLHAYQ